MVFIRALFIYFVSHVSFFHLLVANATILMFELQLGFSGASAQSLSCPSSTPSRTTAVSTLVARSNLFFIRVLFFLFTLLFNGGSLLSRLLLLFLVFALRTSWLGQRSLQDLQNLLICDLLV